jgi:kynureninase
MASTGELTEAAALERDAADPLARFRDEFLFPTNPNGEPKLYLAGMSLGLQPKGAQGAIQRELEAWQQHGVDGWLVPDGWYTADERLRDSMARIVGAKPGEVAIANSLTINLHLLLATFYRPTAERPFLLIDGPTFPSDRYAIDSVIRQRGFDPEDVLTIVEPKPGEAIVATADLAEQIRERGPRLALTLLAGVNYATGQRHDIATLTDVAHEVGAFAGWDLAHAAGNVPLNLHDDGVDFAAWCTYKYLNSGPGGPGALFVHEQHGSNPELPRLAGWWGNDPAVRFKMEPNFVPREGADGWRVSTPSVLAIAPLDASLALFDDAGLDALRTKSVGLTAYLEQIVAAVAGDSIEIITPSDPGARGAQLSLRVRGGGASATTLLERLETAGVVADFREPDLIRVAPVPLYTSFQDCWRFGQVLERELAGLD